MRNLQRQSCQRWRLFLLRVEVSRIKVITIDLPKELEKIEIHPLADLHIGDAMCDYKAVREELEYIEKTPNCYCILDGDLMDTAICSSVGDTYGANLRPMEQLKQCVKLFEPIKQKVLCVTSGNHENRIYKQDGIDITSLMCAQLDIGERYTSTTACIILRFGWDTHHSRKMCYTIYACHGTGGGRKEGGKIQRLADLAQIVDTDIYIMAHVHQPAAFRNTFFRADPRNNSVFKCEHLFVNTASWLDYGGYGDRNNYKPASNINPVIILNGRKKEMRTII